MCEWDDALLFRLYFPAQNNPSGGIKSEEAVATPGLPSAYPELFLLVIVYIADKENINKVAALIENDGIAHLLLFATVVLPHSIALSVYLPRKHDVNNLISNAVRMKLRSVNELLDCAVPSVQ